MTDISNPEWMPVYDVKKFNRELFWGSNNLKDGIFYVCWSGGPSGGFVVLDNKVYKVNEDWDEPLNATFVENSILIRYTHSDGVLYCKIIEIIE